eukprot:1599713-Prymnesium_polylepis.1
MLGVPPLAAKAAPKLCGYWAQSRKRKQKYPTTLLPPGGAVRAPLHSLSVRGGDGWSGGGGGGACGGVARHGGGVV